MGKTFNEGFVLALAIGTEHALEEQDISSEGIAASFGFERFLVLRRERMFAGEEQGAVFVAEEVVEPGAKTKIDGRGGGKRAHVDSEERGAFALPFDLDEATVDQFLEDVFEGGHQDAGEASEIFVADGATGFAVGVGEPPQSQVDGLFRRGERYGRI